MNMNKNEINEKAKKAYQKIFHEESQKENHKKSDNVVFNIDDFENKVEEMKEKEEERISSLDLLRKQINDKAKQNLNHYFVESDKKPLEHKAMDTEEMYQQMKQQECQLFEKVAMMQEKKLNLK